MAQSTIFEVTGSHPNLERNVVNGKPQSTSRHRKNILVATIRDQDVEELKTYMTKPKVDNETAHWNCQDYVIEAIDGLYTNALLMRRTRITRKGRNQLWIATYYGAQ